MSFLDIPAGINPNLATTVSKTAGTKAALYASQFANNQTILAAQKVFGAIDMFDQLTKPFEDVHTELLGGLTPKMAWQMQKQIADAKLTRKNRFFIRITDSKPPVLPGKLKDVPPLTTLNMLAVDVSYGPWSLQSDKVSIGASVVDRVTGIDATEMQITTMDDAAGTLKRWFDGKCSQVANSDGTFGLPADYCVTIEVVHGVASPEVDKSELYYRQKFKMRPHSVNHELSRRDATISEMTLNFQQFDTFYKP
jgi:hypothetical protein